ncbi:MAG: hypothetical protein U0237_13315 [Thermoleophilia bacterium]
MTEWSSSFPKGYWASSYVLEGALRQVTLETFLDLMRQGEGSLTGWPVWWVPDREDMEPYVMDGLFECFMGPGLPAYSDFWRASPSGRFFLARGYQEDSDSKLDPGSILDLTLPIWRTGECLLHASRMASLMGDPQASVRMRMRWTGLAGRRLAAWANPARDVRRRVARQDEVASEVEVAADAVEESLPALVLSLTRPLYEIFNAFRSSEEMVVQELTRLRKRQ